MLALKHTFMCKRAANIRQGVDAQVLIQWPQHAPQPKRDGKIMPVTFIQ